MIATHTDRRPREVLDAEDALNAYLDEHYGPLWGHENNETAERLTARLVALYAKHAIPNDERIAGLEA